MQIRDEIIIKRQLVNKFPNLKKKIGTEPRKRLIVVRPKARPGAFFKTETKIANVTDIVILKSITPINEIIIILSPNRRKGIAPITLINAVFLTPILSQRIPPRAFPIPIET